RRYCYERLKNKESIHSVLIDYFYYLPMPEKVESVDDLAPVIELYHHAVRAGRYDEALELFYVRLHEKLFHRFGAYQAIIELLRPLFPDGEDNLPRLKKEGHQAFTLGILANSYSLSGLPRRAVPLIESQISIREKQNDKKNLATGLDSLAGVQSLIGEIHAAEYNIRRVIAVGRGIKDDFEEAIGHRELGLLLAFRGKFEESQQELDKALELFTKTREVQSQCLLWICHSFRSLFMSNAEEAIKSAIKARELADIYKNERDIIRAEYLLGASYLMKGGASEAEKHLTEALNHDRKINLVELEPDILLEFAKLRFRQDHKAEALNHAEEALQIADRCEYRLKQADIHNFLAAFYLDAGDLKKANEHAEKAKERAECGYKPALEKAEKLLKKIERR
ncbi:MAG: hypothetical protein JJE19_07820, partial [Methanosarcinales archaeon]|nr:hypothetical protein [Methanosarcinales archaeon]